jgi:hypothetical protein
MEADRRYDAAELMMLTAGLNIEALREVMHELWLARQVERAGHDAWRRVSPAAGEAAMRDAASLRVGVKPDELFDHDSFADWFK